MLVNDKENFLKKCSKTLEEILDMVGNLPKLKLNELKAKKTALIIVDMVNGFAREGALKSSRVEALIPEIIKLSKAFSEQGMSKIAFADCHTDESPEFSFYPEHCKWNTSESEIVDEIKSIGGYLLINKNSTNGFIEKEFQNWLINNVKIENFIVTGDCTDICVQQFAITLKTWFNMQNRKVRVIIPANAVDTYDFGMHNAELMNAVALYNMHSNGIELVSSIE